MALKDKIKQIIQFLELIQETDRQGDCNFVSEL